MTKYAILHGNYNVYHAEFDSYEKGKEYYDELVRDEGTYFDLQLCRILESHEAPERDVGKPPTHLHYIVDYSKHDYPE